MGEKEVPIQNIWRTVTEISVTVDVCSGTVKYYILVRGTSEGDKSQSHISSHFAPIEVHKKNKMRERPAVRTECENVLLVLTYLQYIHNL